MIRTLAATLTTALLTLGTLAATTPAHAKDTSWGVVQRGDTSWG